MSTTGHNTLLLLVVWTDQLHQVLLQRGLGQVGAVPVGPGNLLLGCSAQLSIHSSWTLSSTAGTGCTAWSCGSCRVPSSSLLSGPANNFQ